MDLKRIQLIKVTDVQYDEHGFPFYFKMAGAYKDSLIAAFDTTQEAIDFVNEHLIELDQGMLFSTGSATALITLNGYLTEQLEKVYEANIRY